jgi:hypothetical protein
MAYSQKVLNNCDPVVHFIHTASLVITVLLHLGHCSFLTDKLFLTPFREYSQRPEYTLESLHVYGGRQIDKPNNYWYAAKEHCSHDVGC